MAGHIGQTVLLSRLLYIKQSDQSLSVVGACNAVVDFNRQVLSVEGRKHLSPLKKPETRWKWGFRKYKNQVPNYSEQKNCNALYLALCTCNQEIKRYE